MVKTVLRKSIVLLATWALLAFPLLAQTPGLSGTWLGEVSHEGTVSHLEFTFQVRGDVLTGSVRNVDEDQGGPIVDGRIKGNQISFRTGRNNAILITGALAGDRLNLTIDIQDQGQSVSFTATRKRAK